MCVVVCFVSPVFSVLVFVCVVCLCLFLIAVVLGLFSCLWLLLVFPQACIRLCCVVVCVVLCVCCCLFSPVLLMFVVLVLACVVCL